MSAGVARPGPSQSGPLRRLLAELGLREPALAPDERAVVERLGRLAERLEQERFQLAVVGQFKRGKSTLLNALLGMPVLPTGVVPLTAIATLLAYGQRPRLEIAFQDGSAKAFDAISIPALRERVAEFVTETQNPHNARGVAEVRVTIPAALLADGLVVIDTPGIGSAERHNSEAALAALPDCDAALVVLSPDPPITEAEIDYLGEIRGHAAAVMPVLNKIDLVADGERDAIVAYVTRVLERIGVTEPLSLVAAGAVPLRGIAELQERLRALAARRKQLLQQAASLKLKGELAELTFQNDVAMAALKLPVEELDDKLAEIASASDAVIAQRGIASDLTTGERQRLGSRIDQEARSIRERALTDLRSAVDSALQTADDLEAFGLIAGASSAFFEREYRALAEVVREGLGAVAGRAQDRFVPMLEHVRRTAAEALGVPFQVPAVEIAMKPPRELAWKERQADSLNPLPTGMLDRILPAALRDRRRRSRLMRELERIVTLNTENLRWTLRQQADEVLRGFDRDLDRQLRQATASIMALASRARELRGGAAETVAEEIAARERRAHLLAAAAGAP